MAKITVSQLAVTVAENTAAITQLAAAHTHTAEVVTDLCQAVGVMQDDMTAIRAMFATHMTGNQVTAPAADPVTVAPVEVEVPVEVPANRVTRATRKQRNAELAAALRALGLPTSGPVWVAAQGGASAEQLLAMVAA